MLKKSKPKVLVTGSQGFTGKYIVSELLQKGYDVFGLGKRKFKNINYFSIDICNKEEIFKLVKKTQPNYVIHLASISFVNHSKLDDFYKINLIGTCNLLEALAKNNIALKGVILASTGAIYANKFNKYINEKSRINPTSYYAISKLAMEQTAKLWMDKLPITITRPFNYTGVGQDNIFLVPKIVEAFKNHRITLELGDLNISRDFSDVRSVAKVYRRILETELWGKTFNISSGISYTPSQIIGICKKITNHSIQITTNKSLFRTNLIRNVNTDSSYLRSLIGEWNDYKFKETLQWMLKKNQK